VRFFTATAISSLYWRPRRPYQGDQVNEYCFSLFFASLSFFLLSHARSGKSRDSLAEEAKEARFSSGENSTIARKIRVSHTFLLVSVPPEISLELESTRGRDREQPPSSRKYPPVFYIILILCATPREETRNKRPCDDVASSRRPFTFSKIKRECLSTVMLHGNSSRLAKGNGIPSHRNFTTQHRRNLRYELLKLH